MYALAVTEVRSFFGAAPERAARFREQARSALAPASPPEVTRRLRRLGPLFRRAPDARVRRDTDPEPGDLEVLLASRYVTPERTGATWRLLEVLVAANCWGCTRYELDPAGLDGLDFALVEAGVPTAYGLRHLLSNSHLTCPLDVPLQPVVGLAVGASPYPTVLAIATAYRGALPQIANPSQSVLLAALTNWLDGFPSYAAAADAATRPRPDLLGFWCH